MKGINLYNLMRSTGIIIGSRIQLPNWIMIEHAGLYKLFPYMT